MAVGIGQRCLVRVKITDVELRNARDIVATVESPQYVAHCQEVSFDEVSGLVYVSVDVNSVGSWSMWLGVRFDKELFYTPAFVFAEVEGDAKPCDAPYIVDVEVAGESVSVTPPKVDVDAVTREEFEQLSKDVANKVDKVEGKGLSTNDYTDEEKEKVAIINEAIIVDYDRLREIQEQGLAESNEYVAALAQKILAEPARPILIQDFSDNHERLYPTYYAADKSISRTEFGTDTISLYASMESGGVAGIVAMRRVYIHFDADGNLDSMNTETDNLLDQKSVVDKLTYSSPSVPLSAKQGKVLKEMVDKKADKENGYYPTMTVGKADNLVGRGDVQDAQINFRPSGGELGVGNGMNISDAAARIERIKGNSVVWNQRFTFFNTQTQNGVTCVNNGDGSYAVYTDEGGATAATSFMMSGSSTGVLNHILLVSGAPNNNNCYLYDAWNGIVVKENKIYEVKSDTSQIYIRVNQGTIISEPVIFYPQFIDLTQMFTAGNEPTTYEEYLQRKPMNIEDEFAYNEGELIDMKVDSLISTSDNAYDYVKGYARVMGGHTYDCSYGTAFVEKVYFSTNKDNIVAEENAMTSENGKYTFPSDGYAVPYTTDGDVREYCVCLNHSYTKPHPPYQQEVKDLSFIGEAFPEGMRSAGSAFDEIRYNATTKKWEKVTRIGRISNLTFLSGGTNLWATTIADMKLPTTMAERIDGILSDKYVLTSATTTASMEDKSIIRFPTTRNVYIKDTSYTSVTEFNENNQDLVIYYELAEPIIEEIDLSPNFNPDYLAWDFGTEEAIASVPSAPFRADINYEPNAVDDLRWAVSEIRSLRAELAQLQSAASETNLTEV